MTRSLRHSLIISLLLLAGTGAFASNTDINWLNGWDAAQAAARASGKCILAYVYQTGHTACDEMERSTFPADDVTTEINHFQPLALNAKSGTCRDFCKRYGVGLQSNDDKGLKMDFAAIPAYLFLDCNGNEYYRAYGYYPRIQFVRLMQQVEALLKDLGEIQARPNDARLNTDLGHLYLDLERDDLARPYLQRAVKLDPENNAGARADAELDLTLLTIPDDPVRAFPRLVAYQFNNPESKRALEVRYYMAVAQIAAGRQDQAEKILLDFRTIPQYLPDDQKVEGAQYGYLVEDGGQQVGFWMIDDIAGVKQAVKAAGKNPATCTFSRKAINPDYRDHWTELADLLLKQLLNPQGTKPPVPAKQQ